MAAASTRNNILLQQYLQQSTAALQAGNPRLAFSIGEEAVSRGIEHPNLLALAGHARLQRQEIEAAHTLFVRARKLAPRNANILNDLALCLVRLGRGREAIGTFDAALRQTPGVAALHFGKALAYEQLGELDHEQQALERTVAIEPRHVPALNLLALLAAERDDREGARSYAARAFAVSPGEILARMALATVDIADTAFAPARSLLEEMLRSPALDPENRATAQILLGDALDGEGKYARAFESYGAGKAVLQRYYANAFAGESTKGARALVNRLRDYFGKVSPDEWNKAGPNKIADGPRTHAFIVGFLRTGTTLLSQILGGHPAVEIMQERDCLEDSARDFLSTEEGLERLERASLGELEDYRHSYWKQAAEYGHSLGKEVFIDKSPLGTLHLPLIARLFPDAKILFAVRDPRDVVFSCFRRRFAMSAEKYEMLSLVDVADYYCSTMELGELFRIRLGLAMRDVRHENLLSNLEGEMSHVCDFLGLEWQGTMGNFAGRARSSNINTPNSAKLARGLSRDGEGAWRHYENELVPILPKLAPWVARFGYKD